MSVDYALQRIGINAIVTGVPDEIISADKVIFPGVGEASTTMNYLKEHQLDRLIKGLKQPVLGICLGMQLMCSHSEEGDIDCLGIFSEKVKRFISGKGKENTTKVPHMGWNTLHNMKCELLNGCSEGDYVYFVHSYYASEGSDTVATTEYIHPFSAVLSKDNFYATQFHPEKSGKVGAGILENFVKL